jgi:hypothetical protein
MPNSNGTMIVVLQNDNIFLKQIVANHFISRVEYLCWRLLLPENKIELAVVAYTAIRFTDFNLFHSSFLSIYHISNIVISLHIFLDEV